MASADNENPQRDPVPNPEDKDRKPVDDAASEDAERTEDWLGPIGEAEPAEDTEPIETGDAWFEPAQPTAAEESAEPASELGEPPADVPEAPLASDGSSTEAAGAEAGDVLSPDEKPAPGVADTVAFESLSPETIGDLLAATPEAGVEQPGEPAASGDASTSAAEASEGVLPAEATTESAEGPAAVGDLATEGLLAETLLDAGAAGEGQPEGGEKEGEAEAEAEGEKPAEEEEAEKQPGALARLGAWIADTSVYNVLLFMAMVALILGSLVLIQELKSYNWDIKAREGKRPIAAAGADYGPASTTAIA